MGIISAVRTWLNPAPPAIQTRAEMLTLDQRSAAGTVLYAPHQLNRPVWQTGTNQRYVSEGWSKSPVVFACVLAIADAVASAPLRVMQHTRDGQLEPGDDTALQLLVDRPNPSMGQAEFIQTVSVIAALSGFCVVEKERNGLGEVVALWPLRSDWLRPIPREQSAPAWEYRVPGRREPFILEPEDVIVHTHAPDPGMGYQGTAPMAVAFRELGIENAMTDFLKAFFDRGALPVYGIVSRQGFRTQEEADAFRQRIVGRYGGALNSAEPMLLQGVEDVKRIGFDFDELAYPELRNLSELQICTAFRVPPILIGIQAGLDRATYSNAEQSQRFFYENAIVPLWRRLDGALDRGLVPEFDDSGATVLDFDLGEVSALQDDEDALWQRATAALQAGGISRHTYQRLLGLDPHGDDVILQPFSVTPIPVSADGRQRQRPRMTGRVERMAPPQLPAGRSVRMIDYGSEEHRQRWERRIAVTDRWEEQFGTALAEQMEWQRQEVQDTIAGGGRSVREILVDEPFDREKWIRAFQVTMRPIVVNIVTEQAQLAADEVGYALAFDVQDPNVIRAMERQLQRFAESVNDTTWDALRASLAEGIDAGEGIGQLAERVDAVMADRIRSSKEVVARTEVTASSSIGTMESWRQSGVVTGKQWMCVAGDTRVSGRGISFIARRSFVGPMWTLTTMSGKVVTITGDHRVLTRRGWIAAKDIHEGDELVSDVLEVEGTGPVSGMVPDVNNMPPTIEEVFSALHDMASRRGTVRRVVNLDSEGRDCQIDVIAVNGHLRANLEPLSAEGFRELVLELSDEELSALVTNGVDSASLIAHAPASVDGTSGSYPLRNGLIGFTRSSEPTSFRVGANDAMLLQDARDRGLRASPFTGNGAEGQSSIVLTHDVCDVGVDIPPSHGTGGGIGCGDLGSSLFGRHAGDPDLLSFGGAAQGFPHALQQVDNSASGATEVPGNGLGCLPESVAFAYDRCVSVQRSSGVLHVYDYTTSTGWMIANGLVIHNSALDDRTRQSHIEAHGQTVGLDEDFSVGGATGQGPGLMSSAAESVNCRCSTLPVVDTDALNGGG